MNKIVLEKIKSQKIKNHFVDRFLEYMNNPTKAEKTSLDLAQKIISENKKIIYISGALAKVSLSEKHNYEKSKKIIDSVGTFGYLPHLYSDPIKHKNLTPREVRNIDFMWTALVSDGVVFWGNYPSHGTGIEMAWAEVFQVPSIKLVSDQNNLSRLALGLFDNAKIIKYKKESEAFLEIEKFSKKILEA